MGQDILTARGLSKRFGAVQALRGVSLSLQAGEVRAICGENGAGKSTLVKLLMGIHHPDQGSIAVDGVERTIRGPQQAQDLGLALVAQELSLAPHLSVLDNIWLGNRAVPFFHRRAALRAKAAEALAMLGVEFGLDTPVGALTVGQRQAVEIARLITRDARVLILDEPTATLSDVEIERMFDVLKALRRQGRAVLYITHRLGEVFEICDSVTVLRNGEHIVTRPIGGIDRHELIELMLGRSFADMYPAAEAGVRGDGALVVEDLTVPGALQSFSMTAPRGKILCIAGQLGSGATAVTRALAGLVPEATGTVTLDGARLPLGSPPAGRARNVNFVSEDRANEGLFHRSVLENLVATRWSDHTRLGLLSWTGVRREGAELAAAVRVDAGRLSADAFDLSGGNQQKLLFARASGRGAPGVLLMNEPTRGVDVGARAEIYALMRKFCREGWALVMTSSDLEEVVGMADIVVTLYRGRAVNRYEGEDIAIAKVLSDITHPVGGTAAAERAA
jgi:ABC-type sugar transport system ATPase subunit